MAYKNPNNQNFVVSLEDGNSLINISLRATHVDESRNNLVRIELLAEINGGMWTVRDVWINDDSDMNENAKYITRNFYFSECINDQSRKRPRSTVQERTEQLVNGSFASNPSLWINAMNTVRNQAVAIVGSTNDAAEKEIAQLKADLKVMQDAAAADAARSDINALIMQNVVDALTPQITERIRERVGSLVDSVPTRLEVKIRDSIHETSESVRHEKFETVLNIVAAGFPVWLMGEAGTGKSVLCEQIAEALGAEYRYSGAILDEFAGLKGFIDANGVKHGTEFTNALEIAASGKDVVFCMDECDGSTPEVLLVLNNLLSGGAVECMGICYKMNDHLHIIACGNTNGRGGNNAYTRSIIDSATLDRFMMVDVDYSPAIELVSAGNDEQLAKFARTMRQTAKKCGIDMLVTYRAIKRLAKLGTTIGKTDALQGGMLRGLDVSDIETLIYETRHTLDGNDWYTALKSCKR